MLRPSEFVCSGVASIQAPDALLTCHLLETRDPAQGLCWPMKGTGKASSTQLNASQSSKKAICTILWWLQDHKPLGRCVLSLNVTGFFQVLSERSSPIYLFPWSILAVTFFLSSASSSLGRVPDRIWDRHSIRLYVICCSWRKSMTLLF